LSWPRTCLTYFHPSPPCNQAPERIVGLRVTGSGFYFRLAGTKVRPHPPAPPPLPA